MDQLQLQIAARKIFGRAFPNVVLQVNLAPLSLVVKSVLTAKNVKAICCGGQMVDWFFKRPLTPHAFDADHFKECCQVIKALYGVSVSFHDYGTESVS